MCTNKFLIGTLIGVQVSSTVKSGYQENFKPVFFLRKDLHAQKALKHKTSDFHPLRSLWARKIVAFVV